MKNQVTEHAEETQSITEFFSVSLCAISVNLCVPNLDFFSALLVTKQPATHLPDARPGHVDHHFSASLQRLVHLFPHVMVEEGQRSIRIAVDQHAVQIE